MEADWQPIATAQFVRLNTVADLEMENGRIYRAQWRTNGRCVAWFPEPGQQRQMFIALYEPQRWRVIAEGIFPEISGQTRG